MLFEEEIEGFDTLAADCLRRADLLRAQWRRAVLSQHNAAPIAAAATCEEKKAFRFQIEAERLRIIARRRGRHG